eukprot:TRINITY_DN8936_c0_g1_i2.p1 TRINITY_DN8936_c0_g1~~TRINITY_DN8936_c0_g1_i2.p1  ORF type:complete len:520 (+),score=68.23 TRINITY_DN8936_c0_g1_i2:242-1801(+)
MNPTTVAICVLRDNLRPIMPLDGVPLEYSDLTTTCWDRQADLRPTFLEVVTRLKAMASSTSSGDRESISQSHRSATSFPPSTGHSATTSSDDSASTTLRGNNTKKLAAIDRAVEAPSGEIVIVMTDIDHAGVLWEFDADAMKQATITHNALMRASFKDMNAYQVHLKHEEDSAGHIGTGSASAGSFCIAFQHAIDAARWTVSVQEQLLHAEWPHRLLAHPAAAEEWSDQALMFRGLRVRMGMHKGTARAVRDPMTRHIGYTGPLLHKTAKLVSLSQGGQILLTRPVYKALMLKHKEQELPITAVSVGDTVFSDGSASQVYEIKAKSLAGRFFGGMIKSGEGGDAPMSGTPKRTSCNSVRAFASLSINSRSSDDDTSGGVNSGSSVEMQQLDGCKTSAVWDDEKKRTSETHYKHTFVNSANLCRWVIDMDDVKFGKQIGMGSYGVVYKARWKGVDVAVKRFIKQKLSERHKVDFRAEVAFLSEMHHPNIVLFIGACMQAPNLCILTEHVKQGSLRVQTYA